MDIGKTGAGGHGKPGHGQKGHEGPGTYHRGSDKTGKEGRNFVIFAEGHRSRKGNEILDFKSGTFKSAVKAGCPIVPVALINSFRPFDMNSLKQEFVEVHYMEPIMPDQYMGMKTSEIAHLVHNKIQEEINKNVAENPLTM